MSLRMMHVLMHMTEGGLLCNTFSVHNLRDEAMDDARAYWVELGNEPDTMPSTTFDFLIDEHATNREIADYIRERIRTAVLMQRLENLIDNIFNGSN